MKRAIKNKQKTIESNNQMMGNTGIRRTSSIDTNKLEAAYVRYQHQHIPKDKYQFDKIRSKEKKIIFQKKNIENNYGTFVKVSVITVTYNAEKDIGTTIQSVLDQTCSDIEYLIQDGMSEDRTLEIARKYECEFKMKGIRYSIVTKKDHGIYDAMNAAVEKVNGIYVIFMNAGDRLVNNHTIEDFCNIVKQNDNAIYYGDTILEKEGLYKYKYAADTSDAMRGIPFCHQSVFTPRTLLIKNQFNTYYRICADYDFYAKAYREGVQFIRMNHAISIYQSVGFSSRDGGKQSGFEKNEISLKYGFITKQDYKKEKREILFNSGKIRVIKIMKHFFPIQIRKQRRYRILKRDGWQEKIEYERAKCNAEINN
ncbi:MAG: glycosyltransferase [Clostridiales bacterium]|nr:glycosyltransferase [Clostridiales bacterium]